METQVAQVFVDRTPYAACPLCDSSRFVVEQAGDCSRHALYDPRLRATMVWNRCADCHHVFTSGHFTPEALEIVFSRAHPDQQPGDEFERHRPVAARLVDRVLPHVESGIWLDVGFGNGALLLTALEYGFTPVGVDARSSSVEKMRAHGVDAYTGDFYDLKLPQPCAVISMMDVLEHIPYPKRALNAAHQMLRKDGVLLLSMPNMDSPVWKAFDAQQINPYWGELEHYHNFSRARLYSLLYETGFKPVRYGISERYRACMEVIAIKEIK